MPIVITGIIVPTGTGNQGKPGKMGRHFPVREKSGNFVKTGKVREFYSRYWKNQKKLHWKIERNTGKVREICQPVILKTLQIWYHTLNKKRTFKILENCKRCWKSQGNLSVRKSGNHGDICVYLVLYLPQLDQELYLIYTVPGLVLHQICRLVSWRVWLMLLSRRLCSSNPGNI